MKRQWLLGAAILTMVAGTALAQEAGSNGPGGLTARDVVGKRLLDANGTMIGRIESANPHEATVRTRDGRNVTVDMDTLSLGNGPHTVIQDGGSEAEKLNTAEAGKLK